MYEKYECSLSPIFEPTRALCAVGSYFYLSVIRTGPKLRLNNNSYIGQYYTVHVVNSPMNRRLC